MSKTPKVTTIGQLMDVLKDDTTKQVTIPSSGSLAQRILDTKGGSQAKQPKEVTDFDGLMRRCNEHFGQRLCDSVLLKAIATVAKHSGKIIHQVRKMTIAEFNAAFDDAMGVCRFGPDPDRQVLNLNYKPNPVTETTWQFLLVVWGRYNVPFAEIGEKVWGDDMTNPSTIRARASQVKKELAEFGLDLSLSSKGQKVSPCNPWPS